MIKAGVSLNSLDDLAIAGLAEPSAALEAFKTWSEKMK